MTSVALTKSNYFPDQNQSNPESKTIAIALPPTDSCDEIHKTHKISIEEAAIYISDFWTNVDCEPFGTKFGAGAYIPFEASDINLEKLADPYEGCSLFSCIDKVGSDHIYMTIKRDTVCPGSTDPTNNIKDTDTFYQSNIYFRILPIGSRNHTTALKYLKNFSLDRNKVHSKKSKIPTADVRIDSQNYKRAISDYLESELYGFGFFRNPFLDSLYRQQDLQSMPNPPVVKGIACFLGYERKNDEERVRIVLIPVNADGNLITEPNTYCLEKSWPPIG